VKKIYPKYGERMQNSLHTDHRSADLRIALLTNAYTYSASHEFLSDISSGRVALAPTALTSVTTTDGLLNAADYSFSGLSGSTVQRVVIYEYNASESAARLISYTDEDSSGSMSTTPSGGTFTCSISAGIASIGG